MSFYWLTFPFFFLYLIALNLEFFTRLAWEYSKGYKTSILTGIIFIFYIFFATQNLQIPNPQLTDENQASFDLLKKPTQNEFINNFSEDKKLIYENSSLEKLENIEKILIEKKELSPTHRDINFNLGIIKLYRGDQKQGQELIKSAINTDPNYLN